MSDSFLAFNPKVEGLQAKARRANGKFTAYTAKAKQSNEQAVLQMAKWAAKELDRHIRRHQSGHKGILEGAILDPSSHRATRDGFEFLVAAEMDAKVVNPLRPDQGTYWRAIEFGSDASVGRVLPLEFLYPSGHVQKPNGGRAQKEVQRKGDEEDYRLIQGHRGLPNGAFVGGLDNYRYSRHRPVQVKIKGYRGVVLKTFMARRRPTIKIENPIRPYHYARAAVLRFEADAYAYYKDLVRQQAEAVGLAVVFK